MALTGGTASYPLFFPPNTDFQNVHTTFLFLRKKALGLIPAMPLAIL